MMVEDASGSVTVTDATVARCNTGTRQQMLPARTSTLTSMKSAIIHVCVWLVGVLQWLHGTCAGVDRKTPMSFSDTWSRQCTRPALMAIKCMWISLTIGHWQFI